MAHRYVSVLLLCSLLAGFPPAAYAQVGNDPLGDDPLDTGISPTLGIDLVQPAATQVYRFEEEAVVLAAYVYDANPATTTDRLDKVSVAFEDADRGQLAPAVVGVRFLSFRFEATDPELSSGNLPVKHGNATFDGTTWLANLGPDGVGFDCLGAPGCGPATTGFRFHGIGITSNDAHDPQAYRLQLLFSLGSYANPGFLSPVIGIDGVEMSGPYIPENPALELGNTRDNGTGPSAAYSGTAVTLVGPLEDFALSCPEESVVANAVACSVADGFDAAGNPYDLSSVVFDVRNATGTVIGDDADPPSTNQNFTAPTLVASGPVSVEARLREAGADDPDNPGTSVDVVNTTSVDLEPDVLYSYKIACTSPATVNTTVVCVTEDGSDIWGNSVVVTGAAFKVKDRDGGLVHEGGASFAAPARVAAGPLSVSGDAADVAGDPAVVSLRHAGIASFRLLCPDMVNVTQRLQCTTSDAMDAEGNALNVTVAWSAAYPNGTAVAMDPSTGLWDVPADYAAATANVTAILEDDRGGWQQENRTVEVRGPPARLAILGPALVFSADAPAATALNVTLSDNFGHAYEVNASTQVGWSVEPAAGGSFAANVFSPSGLSGAFVVNATLLANPLVSDTLAVLVTAGVLVGFALACPTEAMVASRVDCGADAGRDAQGNTVPVGAVEWLFEDGLGQQLSAGPSAFMPQNVSRGPVSVEARVGGVVNATDITLVIAPLERIVLDCPVQAAVGAEVSCRVSSAEDVYGNSVPMVTVVFDVQAGDGANLVATTADSSVTFEVPAAYAYDSIEVVVTAADGTGAEAEARRNVTVVGAPATLDVAVDGPATRSADGLGPVTFTAIVRDAAGVVLDVDPDSQIAWSSDGPGTWAGAAFTPTSTARVHAVQASLLANPLVAATTQLTIVAGALAGFDVVCPDEVVVGAGVTCAAGSGHDAYGNAVPLVGVTFEYRDRLGASLQTEGGDAVAPTDVAKGPLTVTATEGAVSESVEVALSAGPLDSFDVMCDGPFEVEGVAACALGAGFDAFGNPVDVVAWAAEAVDSSGGRIVADIAGDTLSFVVPSGHDAATIEVVVQGTDPEGAEHNESVIVPVLGPPATLDVRIDGPVVQSADGPAWVTMQARAWDRFGAELEVDAVEDILWWSEPAVGTWDDARYNPGTAAGAIEIVGSWLGRPDVSDTDALVVEPGVLATFVVACPSVVEVQTAFLCASSGGRDQHGNSRAVGPVVWQARDANGAGLSGGPAFTAPTDTSLGPLAVEGSAGVITVGPVSVGLQPAAPASIPLSCPATVAVGDGLACSAGAAVDAFGNPVGEGTLSFGVRLDGGAWESVASSGGNALVNVPADAQWSAGNVRVTFTGGDGDTVVAEDGFLVTGRPVRIDVVPETALVSADLLAPVGVEVDAFDTHGFAVAFPAQALTWAVAPAHAGVMVGSGFQNAHVASAATITVTLSRPSATVLGSVDLTVVAGAAAEIHWDPDIVGMPRNGRVHLGGHIADAWGNLLAGTVSFEVVQGAGRVDDDGMLVADAEGELIVEASGAGLRENRTVAIGPSTLSVTGLASVSHDEDVWVASRAFSANWDVLVPTDVAAFTVALEDHETGAGIAVATVTATAWEFLLPRDGAFDLVVRALGVDGSTGPPARYGPIRVDTAAPVVTVDMPTHPTEEQAGGRLAVIDWRVDDAGAGPGSASATLDGLPIGGPGSYPGQAKGRHIVEVTARDLLGHATTVARAFVVDFAAPAVGAVTVAYDGGFAAGLPDEEAFVLAKVTSVGTPLASVQLEPSWTLPLPMHSTESGWTAAVPLADAPSGAWVAVSALNDAGLSARSGRVPIAVDRLPPVVFWNHPAGWPFAPGAAVPFSVSDDTRVASVIGSVDGGAMHAVQGVVAAPLGEDRAFEASITAADARDRVASSTRRFVLDSIPPVVGADWPPVAHLGQILLVDASDLHLARVVLIVNGRQLDVHAGQVSTTGLGVGLHQVEIVAWDQAGHKTGILRTIMVDDGPPEVAWNVPSLVQAEWGSLEWSAKDITLEGTWLTLDGQVSPANPTGRLDIGFLEYGSHTLVITAIDRLRLSSSASIQLLRLAPIRSTEAASDALWDEWLVVPIPAGATAYVEWEDAAGKAHRVDRAEFAANGWPRDGPRRAEVIVTLADGTRLVARSVVVVRDPDAVAHASVAGALAGVSTGHTLWFVLAVCLVGSWFLAFLWRRRDEKEDEMKMASAARAAAQRRGRGGARVRRESAYRSG